MQDKGKSNVEYTKTADADHDSDASSLIQDDAPSSLSYRPFPAAMKIYYQWNLAGIKVFHVCGETERDRLFAVEVHTGHSMSGPLGARPGLHLYNGPKTKDALLAATGSESLFGDYALNNNSRIFLPGHRTGDLVCEMMRVHTTPDNTVAFRFSIEVGLGEKMRREAFEWKKIKKDERDDNTHNGGFKLFWLHRGPEQGYPDGDSSIQGSSSEGGDREAVAVMSWRSFLTSPKHPFDMAFIGSGLSETMGERWRLMVLMTVLRVWYMNLFGKTHRAPVALGDKVGDKEKAAHQ
ncbi:hypothetical protein EKO27_g6123 [Xylaria grammica]|uniref:Uncharacterized protein n=1 Tax=Xylaria grammica TaxID=363999 RepID=A0A439D3K5_9PEZI|nr:hypothetical protein EKO27_g6123 [Xylaria grammica]